MKLIANQNMSPRQSPALTQAEVGELMGLSRVRVSQIEERALAKLRKLLLADRSDVDLELLA